MSWFKRKNVDDDQEQMLSEIAGGGSPTLPVSVPVNSLGGQPLPPPGGAPLVTAPAQVQMPQGLDLNALLATSLRALSEHGPELRARGMDPEQLQRTVQERMASLMAGTGGAYVITTGGQVGPTLVGGSASLPHGGDQLVAELERISHLHTSGALNDQEFAAAKSKLLSAG